MGNKHSKNAEREEINVQTEEEEGNNVDDVYGSIEEIYTNPDIIETGNKYRNETGAQLFAQVAVQQNVAKNIPKSVFEFDVQLHESDNVRITGIAILEDENILMCNNKSKTIFMYSRTGSMISKLDLGCCPYDVAVLSDKHASVVSFQGEKFTHLVRLFPSLLTERILNLNTPCTGGISACNENIAVGRKHGIDIYNLQGELLRSTASSYTNILYLRCLDDAIAYSDGKYYALKFVINNKLRSMRGGVNHIMKPLGIALHLSGDLYISDYHNDRIIKNSRSTRQSIALSRKDGIYGPRAVCFNQDCSKLFISNNDGESIYIYSFENNAKLE